jgi:hypothetical protein
MNGGPLTIFWDFITSAMGVCFVSIAIVGFFGSGLNPPFRIGFATLGLLILFSLGPIPYSKFVGVAAMGLGLLSVTLLLLAARKNGASDEMVERP